MRNFLSALFFSLVVVGGAWGQVVASITGNVVSPVEQNNIYLTSSNTSLSSSFQLSYTLVNNEVTYLATILSIRYYIEAVSETSQWQSVDTTALPSSSAGMNFVIPVTGLPNPSPTGFSMSNPVTSSVSSANLTLGVRYRVFTVVRYKVVTYDDMEDAIATYYGTSNTPPVLIHTNPNNLSVVSNYNACLNEVPNTFFTTPAQMFGNSYSVNVERKNSQGLWFEVSNTAFSNQIPPSNSTYTNDFRVSLSLHYPPDAYGLNEETVLMPTQSFTFTFLNPNILYLNSNPLKINSIWTTNPTSLSLFVRSSTTSATTNTRIYIDQILSNSSFIGYRSQISPLVSGSNINSSGNRFFASAPPSGLDFNVNINNTSNITVDGVSVPVTAGIQPVNSTWYYYFEYTAACGTSSAWFPIFRLPTPTSTVNGVNYSVQNVCSTSLISQLSNPGSIPFQDGRSYTWAFFATTAATTPLAGGAIVSAGTYVVRYKLVEGGQTYYSDTYTTITVNTGSVYIGPSGTAQTPITQAQFENVNNWCPASTPTNPIINTTVYVDGSYNFTNLTIECNGSLIITETGRVNITNVFTNGGLVEIINGGTIKYGSTVTSIGSCNGTYKNTETFPASSRFWYLGSTITNATRESFGVVGTSNSGTQMWDWTESSQGYTLMGTGNAPLTVGRGYVWKNNSGSTMNVTLTGTYNTAPVTISNLSRQGTGSFAGFHLISNPYTSYLDIHQVLGGNNGSGGLFNNTGSQNMWRDAWVRSINSSGTMIFDAYNATSGIGTGTSTVALSAGLTPTSVGRWIAPMQGVWVRVKPGTTGSIYMDNTMTNANPAGAGQLRSSSAVEGLARINVVYGNQIDQMVAALSPNASNTQDAYDTEKMFVSNYVQVYAPNTGKKFAINTLKNNKSKISMPIAIECPSSGWYAINLAELELPNGVLFLEDKLNGEMKDLTIDSSYQFFANSGVLSTRFVLHFHLPSVVTNPVGPSSLEDLVSDAHNAVISINANGAGKVSVNLDMVDYVTNSNVRITDVNGRVLETFQMDGAYFEFQLNHGQGIYFVEVNNGLTIEKKKVFIQ